MQLRTVKLSIVLFTSILASGCKLALIVAEGGHIESVSESRDCTAGNVCVFQVTNTQFSDSFTAVPAPGWQFVKWNSGGDFFCADLTEPTCAVSNVGADGIAAIEAIIATSKTFYIMPVFSEISGDPITATVTVNGVEWAQVDLFGDLSWYEINSVCPGGSCISSGKLNGHDMTGWTWASVSDINILFNSYLPGDPLGPGPSSYTAAAGSTWAENFYLDGWNYTFDTVDVDRTSGWTANEYNFPGSGSCHYAFLQDGHLPINSDIASTQSYTDCSGTASGAWFYRIAP